MKILFSVLCVLCCAQIKVKCEEEKLLQLSKQWADRLGADLWVWGSSITRKDTFFERYNKSAGIAVKEGLALVSDMELRVRSMLEQKVLAVRRIMDSASNLAASAPAEAPAGFSYYNARELINNLTDPLPTKPPAATTQSAPLEEAQADAAYVDDDVVDNKQLIQVSDGETETESAQASLAQDANTIKENKTRLNLTENPQFFNIPVNLQHSCVHVPSNVYDQARDVLAGIAWSEGLDSIFVQNLAADPTLSWQYFGSGLGFMRQFPAMRWQMEPVDAYDCRTRAWYIDAASSPKDLVILVDRSGSMTGLQKEIAKHVVNNILDTLGNNDYVNIFTFSNVTEPLVPCFNDTLVQANLANIRELKDSMDSFSTENIANFSDSLTVAFRLLENYRIGSRNKSGAGCNQAIMLITDGVQYNYKELFEAYNWRDLPYKPVRVFTYLIGREVSDVREVKWMACANQGYYVQLSTFAEVREQVLHYIPVLARPMVLLGAKPQPTWAPVYADVADPKLTNWLWTQRQRRTQRERFLHHHHTQDTDKNFVHQQKKSHDHSGDLQSYTLMTSVSMPVYDMRQNANISEQVLVKEDTWITVVRETRVANLLGVAGTDVPIQYIQQLLAPHLIGVNGYAFIITNNGYILIHPDLRPVFQGILKPAYNRVDMVEVELPDDDLEPREFNRSLLQMRREMVFQNTNKKSFDMKYHLDDMKRVMRGRRHFYYQGIKETPFTLCVVLPAGYGEYKVTRQPNEDIYIQTNHNHIDITRYFQGDKWRLHPGWRYCKDMSGARYPSPEAELMEFLRRFLRGRVQWSHKSTPCERDLVNALVYEAKCSDFFNNNISTMEEKKGLEVIKKMGFTIAFLATHSGLTRWQDFPQNIRAGDTRPHFSMEHPRAIDEVWYRRAVEQHNVEEDSFVYSVPMDAGDSPYTQVTAAHAVFFKKVPIAVVGHQFYADRLTALLANVSNDRCSPTSNLTCLLLDEHAYVVSHSSEPAHTGHWLGAVAPGLFAQFVEAEPPVYRAISIVDYQAVCFPVREDNNAAGYMSSIVTTMLYLLRLVTVGAETTTGSSTTKEEDYSNVPPSKQNEKEFDKSILINKTRPTACDERRWLYELVRYRTLSESPFNKPFRPDRPYIIQRLHYTNLFLVVYRSSQKWELDEWLPGPVSEPVDYNMSLACRMREDDLPRRRYARCVNRHINESSIQLCGRAGNLRGGLGVIVAFMMMVLFAF